VINSVLQPGADTRTGQKPFQRFACRRKAVKTADARLASRTRLEPGVNGLRRALTHFYGSQHFGLAVAKNSS